MTRPQKPIREKRHRLPRECYRGEVTVALTACIEDDQPLFLDPEVVNVFLQHLKAATEKHCCTVLVYCFMPEHVHLILRGMAPQADVWRAMVDYKQQTGFWLARQRPTIICQKDFYDHIIRADEDLGAQIRYVLNNPVRRGLVSHWSEYPFTGAIGIDLKAVLEDTTTL
jgi:putative transposase